MALCNFLHVNVLQVMVFYPLGVSATVYTSWSQGEDYVDCGAQQLSPDGRLRPCKSLSYAVRRAHNSKDADVAVEAGRYFSDGSAVRGLFFYSVFI